MGRIVDIIVSRDGRVHAVIIDFGGLGIGRRKIAVDWHALFAPAGKPGSITLNLTRSAAVLCYPFARKHGSDRQ
jgi:hypothetical protein